MVKRQYYTPLKSGACVCSKLKGMTCETPEGPQDETGEKKRGRPRKEFQGHAARATESEDRDPSDRQVGERTFPNQEITGSAIFSDIMVELGKEEL